MAAPLSTRAVAVIVPVFNRLDLLRQTVASLRAQTLASAEFILVDDRSEEATLAFLQSLPALDARFRILQKPEDLPRGCQSSRNLGLEACQAETVMFLDSDDLLAPGCLEGRYLELLKHPEADVLVGRQAMFWEREATLRWVNVPVAGRPDLDRCLGLLDPLDVPWVNGGVLIRTAKLRQAGVGWSTRFHWDDLAFHFSCLVSGLRVCWMEYGAEPPDAFYRKHGGEHYGQTLQTADGLRNTADMIGWMKAQLDQAGEWTEPRRQSLVRSWFHLCVLNPVDSGDFCLAAELLETGCGNGLVNAFDHRRFKIYALVRRGLRRSARATYYWNQWVRRTILKEFFTNTPWTYGSVCPPSSVAAEALEELLRATAGGQS
ncbi:MAG: hypothetical protein RLZZ522_548 [Verrucomicrobiota bacterium]